MHLCSTRARRARRLAPPRISAHAAHTRGPTPSPRPCASHVSIARPHGSAGQAQVKAVSRYAVPTGRSPTLTRTPVSIPSPDLHARQADRHVNRHHHAPIDTRERLLRGWLRRARSLVPIRRPGAESRSSPSCQASTPTTSITRRFFHTPSPDTTDRFHESILSREAEWARSTPVVARLELPGGADQLESSPHWLRFGRRASAGRFPSVEGRRGKLWRHGGDHEAAAGRASARRVRGVGERAGGSRCGGRAEAG